MTSDTPYTSNCIHKLGQPLMDYFIPNGTLSNRLLSPITENSAEILSTSLRTNKTSLDAFKKSPISILTDDNSTIEDLNHTLLQKFQQHTTNLHQIRNYLDTIQQHFKALSIILEYLRRDTNFTLILEPIEIRLIQMRAKRDQIDHLLNQSSIKTIMQQISPLILKSQPTTDYNELLTSIQLSFNQKMTLIDHHQNEYRCRKYQINEYSSKLQQRHDLLIKLTNQIEQFLARPNYLVKQANHISIINEHHRQCIELTQLSNEYEQLQNENHLLTIKAKENLQRYSLLNQSSRMPF